MLRRDINRYETSSINFRGVEWNSFLLEKGEKRLSILLLFDRKNGFGISF